MTYDVQPAAGKFYGAKFVYPVRVYYEDTDAGGILWRSPANCAMPRAHQPSCFRKFTGAIPCWQLLKLKWLMLIWGASVRFVFLQSC